MEDAKTQLQNKLQDYLQGKGINTNKPFRCLNPEHEDAHPSMSYDRKRRKVHCFACGADYDIFDLIGIDEGITGFKEQYNRACSIYGITDTGCTYTAPAKTESASDCTAYISNCAKLQDEIVPYLDRRGIGEKTAVMFALGYDPAAFHGAGALVIPTSKHSYVQRCVGQSDTRYMKTGSAELFPVSFICGITWKRPIIIAEGEMDALSVFEVGGEAVALGGTQNRGKLVSFLKGKPPVPVLLSLDNDEAGQKAQKQLYADLKAEGVNVYCWNVSAGYKDANERLINDRSGFIEEISKAMDAERILQERQKEEYKNQYSAAGFMKKFLADVAGSKPPTSTQFTQLDESLGGGLYPGLIVVGGMSSLGKTAYCLQAADQVAASGTDVIIFSLEMPKKELVARSISRISYRLAQSDNTKNAKTARQVLRGDLYRNYNEAEKRIIAESIREYKQTIAPNMYIFEAVAHFGTAEINEILKRHIEITGRLPVVLIDYLQLISTPDTNYSDKMCVDKNVLTLKQMCRDYDITIIAISSLNRNSYSAPVTMASYKESGIIEFSSDVLIGLQLTGCEEKGFDAEAARSAIPRNIDIKILKNRNGRSGDTINYQYYPALNQFTEVPKVITRDRIKLQ